MADNDLPPGFSAEPPKPKGLDAIRGYFKDKGNFLNPNAADALAATSFAETGGDPYAVNKGSKAAAAFQWLGPRKEAFIKQGDTTPEGMSKFAMSELASGRYPKSWAVLNDPNATPDQMKATLIDEFEAPGGSAAKGYGPAGGDMQRARAYKPPKAGDVQKSDLPPPQKAQASSDLPEGFSALPPGFSNQAPGRQDPSIVAQQQQALAKEAEPKTWAEMAKDPKNPMWERIGSAIVAEGQRIPKPEDIAAGLAKNAWGGFTVFGDVASGKASMADPATQQRVMDAAGWYGMKGAPGELIDKVPQIAKEPVKAAEAPTARAIGEKAVGDALGSSVTEDKTPPPNEPSVAAHQEPVPQMRTTAQSGGAAATPVHELAEQNIKAFMDANKSPDLKAQLKDYTNYARTFYSDKEAGKAIIQKRGGGANRDAAQAMHAIDAFRGFTRSLDRENQLGLIKWLQDPDSKLSKGLELSPEAKQFTETFHDWMHTYQKKLEALPQTEKMEFRKNFVTQLWMQPQGAMKYINEHGAKQGSGYFTKGRVFDDYEAGVRAGFAPVTTDPSELFARYIENASKKIASWESLNDAKEQGLVAYRSPQNAPQGWTPLKGVTTPRGEQAYAPPGFASVYNNYTSRLPEGWKGKGLEFAQRASNATTALKLSLSLFHAALETRESWVSGLANSIDKIMGGNPIQGVLELGKSPTKPITSMARGRQVQKAYLDGEFGSPEMQKIVQGLTDANFDPLRQGKIADEYRVSRIPGFIKSWETGRLKSDLEKSFNQPPGLIGSKAKGVLTTGLRAFETLTEPIFQYYVPLLKNGAAHDMLKTYLDQHPNATREEIAGYARTVSDTIDDRFGEMQNDNIFWSKTAKAMARAAAVSYSYTLGTARSALTAGADFAHLPAGVMQRALGDKEAQIWAPRMSYAIALGMEAALTDGIYQYLHTGKGPQSPMDLIKPQTGGTDPTSGQPERATLPGQFNSFRNFWLNPGGEAYSKINDLWKTMIDVARNADYKNDPIYDGNEPVVRQLQQLGDYVGNQMGTPIGITTQQGGKKGSEINSVEKLFGIRAASGKDTDPEGIGKAISYNTALKWYDKRRHDINQQRATNGLKPLHVSGKEKSHLIQEYMRHPEVDPLQKYGGTQ